MLDIFKFKINFCIYFVIVFALLALESKSISAADRSTEKNLHLISDMIVYGAALKVATNHLKDNITDEAYYLWQETQTLIMQNFADNPLSQLIFGSLWQPTNDHIHSFLSKEKGRDLNFFAELASIRKMHLVFFAKLDPRLKPLANEVLRLLRRLVNYFMVNFEKIVVTRSWLQIGYPLPELELLIAADSSVRLSFNKTSFLEVFSQNKSWISPWQLQIGKKIITSKEHINFFSKLDNRFKLYYTINNVRLRYLSKAYYKLLPFYDVEL